MDLESYVTSNLSHELKNWYTSHFSGLSIEDVEENPQVAVNTAVELILNQYNIIGFIDKIDSFSEKIKEIANLKNSFSKVILNSTINRPGINAIDPLILNKIKLINHADVEFYSKMVLIRGCSDFIIST